MFLDFDGTLAPIVDHPEEATLPPATRGVLERLANACPVAIVSGRDVEDVEARVGITGIAYAGSHGFDMILPGGQRFSPIEGDGYEDALASARARLREALDGIEGAHLEAKRFSLAVHDREVEPQDREHVQAAVEKAQQAHERLTKREGKRVHELVPDVDWSKGHAVGVLEERLQDEAKAGHVLYVGDDLTDEDAFQAPQNGHGIVVRDEERATFATHALEDPHEVRVFLERLAHALEEAPG